VVPPRAEICFKGKLCVFMAELSNGTKKYTWKFRETIHVFDMNKNWSFVI
jgi:hypothetical protein